jgi:uncharacterized protein (DUF427 family)
MPRALWNGTVVAESDSVEMMEGNVYFPSSALRMEYFRQSATKTVCSWKGIAHYYHVVVDGVESRDGAWTYPNPTAAARRIANRVAFWRGVIVED